MGGLDFLLGLQANATSGLDAIIGAITYLGGEYFFLVALCFLYWCVDARGSMRLLTLFFFSLYLTGAVKEIAAVARPFQVYPQLIHPRFVETTDEFSFPSGHTVNSTVFWGFLAISFRRRWLYILAPIVVVLVGFSRLYLGLHWPVDVLGGIVFGLVMLGLAYVILRLLAGTPIQAHFPATLILCLAPLFFFVLFPSHAGALSMGVLFGAILGHLVEQHYIEFPVHCSVWQQAFKLLIGVTGALLLLVGLKVLLDPLAPIPGQVKMSAEGTFIVQRGFLASWGYEVFTFIRYALVALWATLVAPAIFRLLFGRQGEQPLRLQKGFGKDFSG